MNINYEQISKIFAVSQDEIESKHIKWLADKKNKSSVITADLNLLSVLSGLSTASISNFLNNKEGSLSREKAEKLKKLVSVVEYLPSAAAKKLRKVQKMSIAFISPITDSPSPGFYTEILKGVKKEAQKYNFYVDIYDVSEDEEKDFFTNMPFLGMVDGIIVMSSKVSAVPFFPLIKRNIPVVLVHPWRKIENAPITDSVVPETAVFFQLLDHLFKEQQFRNPVLISLQPKNNITRKMKIKLFKDALVKYDIPFNKEKNLFIIEQHTFSEGHRAFKELSSLNPKIDVFICLSDVVAASVTMEISKQGRRIGVTGYDNSDIAKLFNLTTIDQKMEKTGKAAFEKLFYAIQYATVNKELPGFNRTIIPLEFMKRASSMNFKNKNERR